MRSQSVAQKDSAAGLIPEVRPRMPWRVADVKALPKFQLRVRFVDGLEGTVDMARLIHSKKAGVFAVLSDPARFNQVRVEYGAVTWPGELDLAPDAMHAEIKRSGTWKLV